MKSSIHKKGKWDLPKNWEVKKFYEIIFEAKLGGNYENAEANEGIPVIKMGNLGRGSIKLDKVEYLPINHSYNESDVLFDGDLLFNTRNTLELVGKVSVWRCELPLAIYNSNLLRLKFHSEFVASNFYMNFVFNSHFILSQLKARATGTTSVAAIYNRDLDSIKFNLPPLHEQHSITTCLSTWYRAIQTTDALIAQKEQRKKWLMQMLLTGKMRLKGFSGEWKEFKLGNVGKIKMCRRIFANETTEYGEIPFFKIGTFGGEADSFISKTVYNDYKSKYSFPKKGEILISASGTIGRTVIYDGSPSYFQDSNIVWISHNESLVLNAYLYYVYQVVKYNSEGGTIQRLYNSIIEEAKFNLPPLKEQTAIAQVLQSSDKEISLLRAKADKLREQKKGLMQVLLTGRVRMKGVSGITKKLYNLNS